MDLPKFLYHGTGKQHLASIQEKGLIPHPRPYHNEDGNFVYLGTYMSAGTWVGFHDHAEEIIIAVDTSKLDKSLIALDRNIIEDLEDELEEITAETIRAWEYAGVIPWDACQVVNKEINV